VKLVLPRGLHFTFTDDEPHFGFVMYGPVLLAGGFGSAVQEWLSDNGYDLPVTRLGIPDSFIQHGSVAQLQRICGIDSDSILKTCIQS